MNPPTPDGNSWIRACVSVRNNRRIKSQPHTHSDTLTNTDIPLLDPFPTQLQKDKKNKNTAAEQAPNYLIFILDIQNGGPDYIVEFFNINKFGKLPLWTVKLSITRSSIDRGAAEVVANLACMFFLAVLARGCLCYDFHLFYGTSIIFQSFLCCGKLKEPSHRDGSFMFQQHT